MELRSFEVCRNNIKMYVIMNVVGDIYIKFWFKKILREEGKHQLKLQLEETGEF